jgi:hypothetical protein
MSCRGVYESIDIEEVMKGRIRRSTGDFQESWKAEVGSWKLGQVPAQIGVVQNHGNNPPQKLTQNDF